MESLSDQLQPRKLVPWHQQLRRERERRNWTQAEVAEKIGSDSRTVRRWESGERAPQPIYLRKLIDLFGANLQALDATLEAGARGSEDVLTVALAQSLPRADWGEAPSISRFYGRKEELAALERWIVEDHCRVVTVLGIGGIGKTALATRLVRQIEGAFDNIFWRSLQNAPPLENFLKSCIQFISNQQQGNLPEDIESQITLLIASLQERRCLLVLDNLETILQGKSAAGKYRAGYEGYSRLIQRIGEVQHRSCCLLTSREKPREVARLEGTEVRSLQLSGVSSVEGREILKDKNLFGPDEAWRDFVHLYSGNPLALQLASASIREVFDGDIAAFLKEGDTIIGDLHDLLNVQFRRLPEQEQEMLYWLAIERDPVSLNSLWEDNAHPHSRSIVLESLDSLRRRSLVEMSGAARFFLQPVIMEYITNDFVERIFQEIAASTVKLFGSHALMKALAKDYLRESQLQLILKPLADHLLITFGKEQSEQKLKNILVDLHKNKTQTLPYAAGNLLNLLIQLGCNVRGYDFSSLKVWQAYLRGVELPEVNFAYADLAQSIFTDTFGGVLAVALNHHGDLLAAATTNSGIRTWRTADGMPGIVYEGHRDWVRAVAYSSDGQLLASGSDDQTIRLWDVHTGQTLKVLAEHSGRVYSVAFSPNGKVLASGSEDQTIRLWDVSTGHILTLGGHTNRVRAVVFSPNGRLVASGSEDQTIRLWDVSTGHCLQILSDPTAEEIWSVAFSRDGQLLASGSEDQMVRLWDVSSGQCLRRIPGHKGGILSTAFCPDGQLLASGSKDQMVRLWDVATGQCLKMLQGHSNFVLSVAFSADGQLLASGSEDQTVRLWDVSGGQCMKILQGHSMLQYSVTFSPDGELLASGSEDQTVRLWDVSGGQCLKIFRGHTNRVRSVAFSPDGQLLASGSDDRTVRLWSIATGRCLTTLSGHTDWIKSVAFSLDGQLLASGSDDQTVRLWSIATGRCLTTLSGHTDWVWSIAFSAIRQLLASGSEDQTVRLWDVPARQCLAILQVHSSGILSVAFSPDGQLLACGGDDQVRLWDVSTGQSLKILPEHGGKVYSVTFSPDGQLLASAGEDQTLRLWDTATGRCLKSLRGHSSWLYSVDFHPDGEVIASSSGDGTIRLWDVNTGQVLRILRGDRPYERMNIRDASGLTAIQKATLKELGAIDDELT